MLNSGLRATLQQVTRHILVLQVVTGTGKTVMALMAASEFVSQHNNAVISVVVPSKVLMYQWAEEAAKILAWGK